MPKQKKKQKGVGRRHEVREELAQRLSAELVDGEGYAPDPNEIYFILRALPDVLRSWLIEPDVEQVELPGVVQFNKVLRCGMRNPRDGTTLSPRLGLRSTVARSFKGRFRKEVQQPEAQQPSGS